MAFANSAVTDIIATTIQSRSRDLADNFTNNNAALRRLRSRGNVKPFGGGNVILQELAYNDSTTANVNSYSGYEILNIAPNSPISAAQYSICQYAAAVSISGLEMLQNSGEEALIDLLEARISVAEGQLMNRLASDLYGDGTGNGGKNITGLAALVSDAAVTGTVGGINKATFTFWQNQLYRGLTNGGAAVSAANIQAYMTALAIKMVRGNDKTDLILSDATYYQYYVNSLQAMQKVASADEAGAGFASIKFYGGGQSADVVLDGGLYAGGDSIGNWTGASANHMYFLNTKYLFWRPHRDRNFVPIGGERQAVNQDAVVKLIGVAGNLCSSNLELQGVLIGT